MFTVLGLIVEFTSSSFTGSESLKGIPVTLLITQGSIDDEEHIVINVVATSHSPISAEGMVHVHLYSYMCMHIVKYVHMYVHACSSVRWTIKYCCESKVATYED